jgi:hypothetical protein
MKITITTYIVTILLGILYRRIFYDLQDRYWYDYIGISIINGLILSFLNIFIH